MTIFPRVSVCMVTYCHQAYVRRAIESALGQKTSFAFDVVVSDDASTDSTADIIRHLAGDNPLRLLLTCNASNVGPALNFEANYARCRGEFVAFLEGDDYWTDPHKLQRQVDALDQHPEWSGCFHQAEYVDPAGRPLGKRHPVAYREPVTFDDLCRTNWVQTCSLMVRKSAVPQIPEWFRVMAVGDWPLCLLATISGPLGMLPEPMACYRVHPGGVWMSQSHCVRVRGFLRAYATVAEHLPPEYTLRLLRGQQHLTERIVDDYDGIVNSFRYRLGRLLADPIAWLYERLIPGR